LTTLYPHRLAELLIDVVQVSHRILVCRAGHDLHLEPSGCRNAAFNAAQFETRNSYIYNIYILYIHIYIYIIYIYIIYIYVKTNVEIFEI
jgi:hypothetical protein